MIKLAALTRQLFADSSLSTRHGQPLELISSAAHDCVAYEARFCQSVQRVDGRVLFVAMSGFQRSVHTFVFV